MGQYIDLKFKDAAPSRTVEKIRKILQDVGIEIDETWYDSGIENCCSVHLRAKGIAAFGSTGKGITRELAQASGYGEFIERLQCGRQRFLYQTYERDPQMYMHAYASDAKYMTMQELEENGEWMDYLIRTYPSLTRKKIAKFCRACEFTNEDRILTVPFYSLLEDKYVYLPVGYVEIMYTANGCCAGNSKEEAWLHAISEIFERKCHIDVLRNQDVVPKFSREFLQQFPTIQKIMETIEAKEGCALEVLDYSGGLGYPVVGVQLVDKKEHGYLMGAAADPVLEIAIERVLTEMFQGRNLKTLHYRKDFLEQTHVPLANNIINEVNWGLGDYSIDFLAGDEAAQKSPASFPDNTGKTNRELLLDAIAKVKALDRPIYVRNYSFLDFDTYKIVVPGFSETRAEMLFATIADYFLEGNAAMIMRSIKNADKEDLQLLMAAYKKAKVYRSVLTFDEFAGISFSKERDTFLFQVTLAYACYALKNNKEAYAFLAKLSGVSDTYPEECQYYSCVRKYLQLIDAGVQQDKIKSALYTFYESSDVDRMYALLENGGTPFDMDLLQCDPQKCDQCRYINECSYNDAKKIIMRVGKKYAQATDAQDRKNFAI